MLYTASVFDLKEINSKMKVYYLMKNYGNNVVVPDQADLDYYRNGILTWEGFKINYLAKIYKKEANEWMKKVSKEAVSKDVVLVDEEKDENHSCRKILAELMKNMYTGKFNFKYVGEITTL